tara:strand:+ start:1512 stop:1832 length:321 start_codon:yes stop_codon:yes gene_type:complete
MIRTTPKNPIKIADHLYIPTLSFKKIIDKITIKKGDEKVRTIAVANSRLITEINIKIFIDKKPKPLKKLKIINLLSKFLKTEIYSFVNKISKNSGMIPAIFLKTAS